MLFALARGIGHIEPASPLAGGMDGVLLLAAPASRSPPFRFTR